MPKFSNQSLERLYTCHTDLQLLFNTVIEDFDCTIICGHRDAEAQNEAYRTGNSKLRYPQSKHNTVPSIAVDVAPYPIDWNDLRRFCYFAGFVVATSHWCYAEGSMKHKIRWGGDWDMDTQLKDNRFNDLVHFELVT